MARSNRDNRRWNSVECAGDFSALEIERVGEGNSEEYRLTFNTADNGGQPMIRRGHEVRSFTVTIVGGFEMSEFVDLVARAYRSVR